MSSTRTSTLVVLLLGGVVLTVLSYVDTRRPLDAASQLAEQALSTPAAQERDQAPQRHALELRTDPASDPITEA